MKVVIRKAELSDVNELQKLNYQFLKDELIYDKELKADKESWNWGRRFTRNFIIKPDYVCFVAEDNKKIIGFLTCKIEKKPPIFKKNKSGYIWLIYVMKDYRGKGIGKKLIKFAFRWFKSKKIGLVELDAFNANKNIISMWKNFGFKTHLIRMRLKI